MKILIVTSCFAPKNVIGAIRLSKLAKYLVREGHSITVVSPVLESYDLVDKTLECKEFETIKRITVPYSGVTSFFTRMYRRGEKKQLSVNKIGNQTNNSIKDKLYRKLRDGFSDWRDYEWKRKVNKVIQSDNTVYDLVISSSPNVSTHDSAFYAKKTGRARKWVADFRDPIVLESSIGKESDKLVKKQSLIVQRADLTTHVSKAGTENFICYSEDKHKVIWIPNGFDEDDFKMFVPTNTADGLSDGQRVIFSYTGGLYKGERDCSPLFKAIRELMDEGAINENNVQFNYAGRDYGILKNQADFYHVSQIIKNYDLIPRMKSLEMQAASDCVVVATNCYTDNGGSMTGKIYEPVMMKKKILLLVNGCGKNSEPGVFIKQLNAGMVYEESADNGNVSFIKSFIQALLKEKKQNGFIQNKMNEQKRLEYSYAGIIRRLMDKVHSLN